MTSLSPVLQQATPLLAVRGEGPYLFDADDRRYLDFTAGIGVTSTGHCHPRVVAAVQAQAAALLHGQYTTVRHGPLVQLAERLAGLAPPGLDRVFFASAGTEAVEAALRLARHATGRPNLVALHGGFHGRTIGSASLTTSKTSVRAGLQPLMPGAVVAPYPYAFRYGWDEDEAVRFCLRELDYLFATVSAPDETAAIVFEPVLGEGGYVPMPREFALGLRDRCDRHGILLIADEVQTGVGRTGKFWGHEHLGVRPDAVVAAKGLASGLPLSALIAPREIMAKAWPGSQGGTYGGNPVACAAALATLDVIAEEGLVERARVHGDLLVAALRALAAEHRCIGDVRGLGLMAAIELVDRDGRPDTARAQGVQAAAVDEGLLLLTCGAFGNVVRFIPPLVIDEGHLDEGMKKLGAALARS